LIFEKYIRLIILMGLLSHVCHGACCAQTPFDPAPYQAYLNQIRTLIALSVMRSKKGRYTSLGQHQKISRMKEN